MEPVIRRDLYPTIILFAAYWYNAMGKLKTGILQFIYGTIQTMKLRKLNYGGIVDSLLAIKPRVNYMVRNERRFLLFSNACVIHIHQKKKIIGANVNFINK